MQTWELVTVLASLQNIPLRLFLPISDHQSTDEGILLEQFGLTARSVELIPLAGMSSGPKEDVLLRRDEAVVEAADVLIPVSVRRCGHMEKLLEAGRAAGKQVVEDFRLEKPDSTAVLAYSLERGPISPDLASTDNGFLIHWTRATNSAWPGEKLIDYWRAVLASVVYPRAAFDTLRRILTLRCLIASSRHMPANVPTVSFSALSPLEVIPLMRWRARYTQMSFEPYGVGISRSAAAKLGLVPVRYYSGATPAEADSEECWQWQSTGTRADWRQEKEYRHLGNLAFGTVPPVDLIAFTRFPEEASAVYAELGIRTIPFLAQKDTGDH